MKPTTVYSSPAKIQSRWNSLNRRLHVLQINNRFTWLEIIRDRMTNIAAPGDFIPGRGIIGS